MFSNSPFSPLSLINPFSSLLRHAPSIFAPSMESSQPLPRSETPYSSTTNFDFISRAKTRIYGTLQTRRPWRQIFDHHALSTPHGISHAVSSLKTNLSYFHVNFAIVILLILFLSLIYRPISLIVFLVVMVGWLFLYFLRDEPLVLFDRTVDEWIVLAGLSILTVGSLLFTDATGNILISLAVGVGIVVIYSVFRRTDDLFLDEEAAVAGGLVAGR